MPISPQALHRFVVCPPKAIVGAKSAIGPIVLQNSAGLVAELAFPLCVGRGAYSRVSMRGKQLPEVAGHGREAWRAASGSAR
jgi:hypothetical protein